MGTSHLALRIGIVSWNTAELLDRCLAAIPAALGGVQAEVVVVDNDSRDGSAETARRHAVPVIENRQNIGYARAMNTALTGRVDGVGETELLLALNPDTVPRPGSLAVLVEHLVREPEVGVAVPRLVHPDGRHQHSAYRFPHPLIPVVAAISTGRLRRGSVGRRLLLEGSGPHAAGRVDWAIGAVHLIRRSALGGEVPYDERSFMYAEDLDLCWRLAQRGWRTDLVDGAVVEHVGNAAGAQAFGDTRSARYWRASYDTITARRGPTASRAVAVGCTVATLLSLLRLGLMALRGRAVRDAASVRLRELRVHLRAALARR